MVAMRVSQRREALRGSRYIIWALSKAQAEDWTSQEPYAVISFYTPGTRPAHLPDFPECQGVLYVCVHDVDTVVRTPTGEIWFPMLEGEVDRIVKFVRAHQDQVKHWVVHCEAGISRSAGCAAALAEHFEGDKAHFFRSDLVYSPNRHILSLLRQKLGVGASR